MKSKSVVIFSNYYPPEMGAAANRIKNMAVNLTNNGYEVTVVCPLPNYPKGEIFKEYKGKFSHTEIRDNITIKRYWLYPSTSKNPFLRFLSMFSFSFTLWFSIGYLIRKKSSKFIIQSPPLFVALSSLLLSKVLRVKTYLNVSDIWPLSALELGVVKKGKLYSVLEWVEKTNYKLADSILTQSVESKVHVEGFNLNKPITVYRNVPRLCKNPVKEKNQKLRIVYAGLLGYAQGIYEICEKINFKELDIEFHIYGAGMDESAILKYTQENQDSNIYFHGSVSADKINDELLKYDFALVSLKTHIYGAVPSKIFELLALGIPILFKGSGEGEQIVKENSIGFTVLADDFNNFEKQLSKIKMINQEEYTMLSSKCLKVHNEVFNLSIETRKLLSFIEN